MTRNNNKTRLCRITANRGSSAELIRFRVDRDLKRAAEAVCAGLDLDLNDVLRSIVRRIAHERALPFEVNTPPRPQPGKVPFAEYNDFLKRDLAHLKGELTLGMLATFIADRTKRIAEARGDPQVDAKLQARWERELRDAAAYHRTLDTRDTALVEQLDARFRALLAEER